MTTNQRHIKAILLDFDGTLIESFFDWKAIRAEMGIGDVLVLDAIAAADEAEKERLWAIMERHEEASARGARPMSGADALLEYLRSEKIPHAVVSNNHSQNVIAAAKRCALDIPSVVGRDAGGYKPSPEPLLIAARRLGVRAAECAVLGDNTIDMKSAAAAGMTAIYLSEKKNADADYYVSNLTEALAVIRELC
jgi:HAD superfamily hydrolase (TIGR01509 family)